MNTATIMQMASELELAPMFERKVSRIGARQLRSPSAADLATLRLRMAKRDELETRQSLEALRIELTVQAFPAGSLTGVAVAAIATAFSAATIAPESMPDALIVALVVFFSAITVGILRLGLVRQGYEASASAWAYALDRVLAEGNAIRAVRGACVAEHCHLVPESGSTAEPLISIRPTVHFNWILRR